MFASIFSTTIWLNVTSIFALLYAIYLCSVGNQKLLKGNNIYIISNITNVGYIYILDILISPRLLYIQHLYLPQGFFEIPVVKKLLR